MLSGYAQLQLQVIQPHCYMLEFHSCGHEFWTMPAWAGALSRLLVLELGMQSSDHAGSEHVALCCRHTCASGQC